MATEPTPLRPKRPEPTTVGKIVGAIFMTLFFLLLLVPLFVWLGRTMWHFALS